MIEYNQTYTILFKTAKGQCFAFTAFFPPSRYNYFCLDACSKLLQEMLLVLPESLHLCSAKRASDFRGKAERNKCLPDSKDLGSLSRI